MSTFETLLTEQRDAVSVIRLNRPDVFHAINATMRKELLQILNDADRSREVRCIVLTGTGERAFCSGQDLNELTAGDPPFSLKAVLEEQYHPIIQRLVRMEKPVLAMINGVAAGAGFSLALAADVRIMSDSARLISVFVRVGLVPDCGSHWMLTRLVGPGRAFEYAALGEDIPADEALRAGLVNKVVPAAELESVTLGLAGRLAAGPTRAIGLMKRATRKSLSAGLEESLLYEAHLQQIAFETADCREGLAAFREKRPPRFSGS